MIVSYCWGREPFASERSSPRCAHHRMPDLQPVLKRAGRHLVEMASATSGQGVSM
jgi:hypothetical protein